jgi:hypothetical protein
MKIYFNAGNGDGTKEDNSRGRPFRYKLLPAPCHQVNLLYHEYYFSSFAFTPWVKTEA